MRYLVMAVLFLVSLILQATVFSHLTVVGVKPDLVLVFTVLYALLHGPKEGLIVGFMGGLMQDSLMGHSIGLNLLSKTLAGWLFGALERKVYKENLFIPMFAVFLATFFHDSLVYVLHLAEGTSVGYFASVRSIILSTAVYNTCLVPLVFRKFYNSYQKGLIKPYDFDW